LFNLVLIIYLMILHHCHEQIKKSLLSLTSMVIVLFPRRERERKKNISN